MNTDPTGMCLGPYCTLRCKTNSQSNNAYRPNSKPRDVTRKVNAVLLPAAEEARLSRTTVNDMAINDRFYGEMEIYIEFFTMVTHEGDWDIKRKASWNNTIDLIFPGRGAAIIYEGVLMTPECLGNYTYGYLGASYGFPQEAIILGSYAAAGFPNRGKDFYNEHIDQSYVLAGYKDGLSK